MSKRNVTVVLSDESARWLRVEAAHNDTSVSRYLGALVDRERNRAEGYDDARARFMARKPRLLGTEGRDLCEELPSRDEVHERTGGSPSTSGVLPHDSGT